MNKNLFIIIFVISFTIFCMVQIIGTIKAKNKLKVVALIIYLIETFVIILPNVISLYRKIYIKNLTNGLGKPAPWIIVTTLVIIPIFIFIITPILYKHKSKK